jgi:formylglycine-generating enzyme required for sulfatase activity
MKAEKTAQFLLFCVIFVFLFSCKPDDPPIDSEPEKICTTDSLVFNSLHDAELIYVDTKADWKVSCPDTWINISSATGKGKTGIFIGVNENKNFARSTSVKIKTEKKEHSINIHQESAPLIEFEVSGVKFNVVYVKGGVFTLGEQVYNPPAHQVQLSDYFICQTEVTNALWQAVMGSLPYSQYSQFTGKSDYSNPLQAVTAVTWNDIADKFLPAIKTKTGLDFRLPTEAEWEYAALGGIYSKGFNYSGSNNLEQVGWDIDYSLGKKKNVALKFPNELNIYDMSGNVAEWCTDWYINPYESQSGLSVNPQGPSSGDEKVVRGGSYLSEAVTWENNSQCRVKKRLSLPTKGTREGFDPLYGFPITYFFLDRTGFRMVLPIKK